MKGVYAVSLLVVAVFAGCLGDGNKGLSLDEPSHEGLFGALAAERLEAPTDVDFSAVVRGTHEVEGGHAIRALHGGAYGLERVGYNSLANPGLGLRPVGFAAADVWENYVAVQSLAGGVVIVDIFEPANPRVLSVAGSTMVAADAQFSDDGRYLFAGCFAGDQRGGVPELGGTRLSFLADAGDCGVTVWDVADKTNPRFLFNTGSGTYHNLFTATIDGTAYLFQVGGDIQKLVEDPEPHLESVAEVPYMVHDLTVSRSPVTGDWWMYTGGAEGGLAIYDVNDPADPLLIGTWMPAEGEVALAWHDQQPLMQLVDGRALVVGAGEVGDGSQVPIVVLDVTDVDNITKVGEWLIPGKPENAGPVNFFTMGPHEFEVWNGYIALGHYHSGVWLIDVGSPERAAQPATLGYYIPDQQGAGSVPMPFNPWVWGAYFDARGYIVATDVGSGLYVLKFGATLE